MAVDLDELGGVRIPLRDGSALVGDVFLPRDRSPRPAIVEITPYTRARGGAVQNFSGEAPHWVASGYAFVLVDVRGQGDSRGAGRFRLFAGDGADCADVIGWIARQPWCDGRVAMRGASYTGSNQWLAAREHPPALRALVPNASAAFGDDDIAHVGGALQFLWALNWPGRLSDVQPNRLADGEPDWAALLRRGTPAGADVAASGRELPLFRELLGRPRRGSAPPAPLTADDYARIELPTLAFSGWFDGTLRGTIRHFQGMRAHSPARERQWLIVGPWEHGPCSDGGIDFVTGRPIEQVGGYAVPADAVIDGQAITTAFYDAFLRGGAPFSRPPVSLYLTGSNRWVHGDDFPLPGVVTRRLHLHSGGRANRASGDGRLAFDAPGDEPPDRFRFDPTQPAPSLPPGRWYATDLAPLLARDDMLVYLGDPVTAPLTICGEVELVLHVASDGPDTDFVARLEDVDPAGRGMKLGCRECGIVRLRWRDGFADEQPLTPGVPVVARIRLDAIGHTLLPGHRLRLSVTSSAYPRFFPNPNTGADDGDEAVTPRPAQQLLLHDAAHPSHLLLPLLPTP